jgi:hypothetical protein
MAQKKRVFKGVRSPHNASDSGPGDEVPSRLARAGSLLAKLSQLRRQEGLSVASSKTPSIVIFMIPFHYYYLAGKLSAVPSLSYIQALRPVVSVLYSGKSKYTFVLQVGECYFYCTKVRGVTGAGKVCLFLK